MDELIYAAQRGDDAALAVLWERVKQYACAVACRFKPCAFADFDDFRQCAYLGFRAAVRAYTGIGFLNLVRWCTLRECQKVTDLYGSRRQVRADSLDVLLPDGETTPADLVPDESLPPADARIACDELVRDVRAAVAALPDRERRMIETRWLCGDKPLTLEEAGQSMGINNRERAHQIEQRAFRRLRNDPVLMSYMQPHTAAECRGVGLSSFMRDHTSSVEADALARVQQAMRKKRRADAYTALLKELVADGLSPEELASITGA